MITKIEARNFRCLRAVSQTLGRFHVVAGPNGSGKSTFFDVPRLLNAFGREGLQGLLSQAAAQTFEEILYQGRGHFLELAVEMTVPGKLADRSKAKAEGGKPARVIRYEVRIGRDEEDRQDETPRILVENLWLLGESPRMDRAQRVQMDLQFPSASFENFEVVHATAPRRGAEWRTVAKKTKSGNSYFKSETTAWNLQIRNAADDSALSSLPADDRFPIANWFRDQLLKGQQHLALRSEEMRRPSPPLKNAGFLPDGSNLPHVVARMSRTRGGFRNWIEHLQTVLPIEDLEAVTREEDRSRYLRVRYKDGGWVPSWHLSDGTLRMLALTLLAYMPDAASSTFIEEPENGIHPRAVEAVFQSLRSVYEGQILVATHSPVFVSLVEPKDLLCFSKTPVGETDIVLGSEHPRLRDWKADVPLARLYAAGILS
jgi:predicted ATPase